MGGESAFRASGDLCGVWREISAEIERRLASWRPLVTMARPEVLYLVGMKVAAVSHPGRHVNYSGEITSSETRGNDNQASSAILSGHITLSETPSDNRAAAWPSPSKASRHRGSASSYERPCRPHQNSSKQLKAENRPRARQR